MPEQRMGSAPGKIILSGEYAVVFGYKGIAIPATKRVTATWDDTGSPTMEIVLEGIVGTPDYPRAVVDRCREKGGSATGRLTIHNDIPVGKGMGSSSALVVAVCKCLLGTDRKTEAILIEDTVNPGNSGLDFAVAWNSQPVIFVKGTKPEIGSVNTAFLKSAVLVDSGTPAETTPQLVAWMRDREEEIRPSLDSIGQCTERLLKGESPMTVFPDHHKAQVALGVVPQKAQDFVKNIELEGGAAKVIGAGGRTGGAGMILTLHPHSAILQKIAEKHQMPLLPL